MVTPPGKLSQADKSAGVARLFGVLCLAWRARVRQVKCFSISRCARAFLPFGRRTRGYRTERHAGARKSRLFLSIRAMRTRYAQLLRWRRRQRSENYQVLRPSCAPASLMTYSAARTWWKISRRCGELWWNKNGHCRSRWESLTGTDSLTKSGASIFTTTTPEAGGMIYCFFFVLWNTRSTEISRRLNNETSFSILCSVISNIEEERTSTFGENFSKEHSKFLKFRISWNNNQNYFDIIWIKFIAVGLLIVYRHINNFVIFDILILK